MTSRLRLLFNCNTLLESVLSYIENQYGLKVNELNTDAVLGLISTNDFLSVPDEEIFTILDNHIHKILLNNESYFFRFPGQLDIIKRYSLRKDKINVLSFGCSKGEEAYSVVMYLKNLPMTVEVYCVDIDKDVVEKGRKGVYSKSSLREIPKEYEKFFTRYDEVDFLIADEIRDSAKFIHMNILKEDIVNKFEKEFFDIILINNVMIYMTDAMIEHAIKNLSILLKNDGLLFTSEEESSIRHLNNYFLTKEESGIKFFSKQNFSVFTEMEYRQLYNIEYSEDYDKNIDYEIISSSVKDVSYEEALSSFEKEDFLKSIGILYRLIKNDPVNHEYISLMARACYKSGFATESKKWLKTFLILNFEDEKQIEIYMDLCLFTKDYPEYIEMLDKKIKFFKNPEDIKKLQNLYDEIGLIH